MTLPLDTRLRVAQDVQARRFHDEIVILDLGRGEYFSLDEVGVRIWEALDGGKTLASVVTALAAEYDADEVQLSLDVAALAEELLSRHLVVEVK
jgi:Coenzyme PQQ synthesis protein D (PqqD)